MSVLSDPRVTTRSILSSPAATPAMASRSRCISMRSVRNLSVLPFEMVKRVGLPTSDRFVLITQRLHRLTTHDPSRWNCPSLSQVSLKIFIIHAAKAIVSPAFTPTI